MLLILNLVPLISKDISISWNFEETQQQPVKFKIVLSNSTNLFLKRFYVVRYYDFVLLTIIVKYYFLLY